MAADLRVSEPTGAALEQFLRLRLSCLLGCGIGLFGVADVGERYACAGIAEHLAERERVGVVLGAVVGDDHMGLHRNSLLKRVVARRSNRVDAER